MPGGNYETFPALALMSDWLIHGFTLRERGIDVQTDRDEALARLSVAHLRARAGAGAREMPFVHVNQVHGRDVAVISNPSIPWDTVSADSVATNRPGICLGIYVADCCPVFFADPIQRCIAIAHAGRKGAELGIATATIEILQQHFGSVPSNLVALLGPCIRPPDYDVDFAAQVINQCRNAGVINIHDCGVSTATDLARYYSYRAEKGRTGRMLAFAAIRR
jgi:copper oxidase (laccase) domain-containing protein